MFTCLTKCGSVLRIIEFHRKVFDFSVEVFLVIEMILGFTFRGNMTILSTKTYYMF
jgi:hypothetical protein